MNSNLLVFSRGILSIPFLQSFLPEYHLVPYKRFTFNPPIVQGVIGWGLRPSTIKARAYADKKGVDYIALEDGFLRSLGLGVNGYPPYSIVFDDLGIYYDTTKVSRLEKLILNNQINVDTLQQAERALMLIKEHQLSKYNHSLDFAQEYDKARPIVLVIDQTYGDMAVKYGQAKHIDFQRMLDCAINENPHSQIWVKVHPDVISGKKKGYLTSLDKYDARIRLFSDDVNPISLLKIADKVYCVTSQMGFEALLLGKTVVTFGLPWYAGWGLTDDRHNQIPVLKKDKRRIDRTLLQVFAAAYLQYSRYINPYTGESGTIFDVINYLVLEKEKNKMLSGHLYCVGMSLWKRNVIKPFFDYPQCHLHFIPSIDKLKKQSLNKNTKLLVWGNGKQAVLEYANQKGLPVLRMEDGFIRSVGLGSNLVSPLSLVIDDIGIYFNAEMPSRLENILQNKNFTEEDLILAKSLQSKLINQNIGKYNVGNSEISLLQTSKRTILVPGQVEDDASIRYGSPVLKKNLDLLKQVRELNPDAYIFYKPHPDVESGNRQGKILKKDALKYADEIIEKANILNCINQVDEIHTMTSLAGFEALLRGKKVYCYGLPFYSNWGLTKDFVNLERRKRKLTLLELIAGVLIYYPQYRDQESQRIINVEQAINILQYQRKCLDNDGLNRSWGAKQFGKLQQLYKVLKQ
ncbi:MULTISPECIES: capsular polysaccharide biosynthesis protein [unclassified Avibacterium]|uniref:capsular polysaccharide biosynthesis protein n=1 Tax=unclassified Avibacterium TaxID=2685287 RepID=UPI0020267F15|nr:MULTISPECIES: capsular polysaccharide biosynthesis protein [unclassified Avibacterium]MCW9698306.1 capsular polysaccharide biosynthesis protein [Avibacterium sp. 20-129]URL07449.1 capsular polysaccharide biosynthesis protein [Avibacterium sp. 21-595]